MNKVYKEILEAKQEAKYKWLAEDERAEEVIKKHYDKAVRGSVRGHSKLDREINAACAQRVRNAYPEIVG